MKHFKLALEEIDKPNDGLVQEVPVDPEQSGKIIDIIESEQVQDKVDDTLEQVEIATESLIDTYDFLKSMGSHANYSTQVLAINQAQTVARMMGAKVDMPRAVSLEAFEANKEFQLEVAMETLKESIKSIWEKIVAFFKRIYDWIRTKINTFGQNIEKLRKYKAELDKRSGTFGAELKTTGYLSSVLAYRDGEVINNLVEDLKAISVVFNRFTSKTGRGYADEFVARVNNSFNMTSRVTVNSFKFCDEAVEHCAKAFNTELQDGEFQTRTLPGNVSLKFRAPKYTVGAITFGLVSLDFDKPGSISVSKAPSDKPGQMPKALDEAFVKRALGFIEFTLRTFDELKKNIDEFPNFKINEREIQRPHVEKSATTGTKQDAPGNGFEISGRNKWKYAATLQMFYGVWATQVCGGLMQTSFALGKLVEKNIVSEAAK